MAASGSSPFSGCLGSRIDVFYGWEARRRHPSPRDIEEVWLTEQIERIHKESGETYGSPKVHAQLRREGIRVSRKRSSTSRDPAATPAPDLVNRNFKADAPDRLWVADISRIPTGEGALWLASVRDAFSRRVVGWKASDRADTELVLGALEYALWSRNVERERLVFHSDHGTQYTAIRFTQRLEDAGARPSMGTVGDSLDNALAENFFSSLKVERVYRTTYRTREEAELDLVRWIDGWYNPRRIQRELGWLSPDEYEEAYYRRQSTGAQASPASAR